MDTPQDEWGPCPQGQLGEMVQVRQARRRRQILDRLAVGTAALVLLVVVAGVAATQFVGNKSTPNFGGIACANVRELMPRYAAGSLDAETTAKIDEHLEECPHCRPLAEELLSRTQAVSLYLWRTMQLAIKS